MKKRELGIYVDQDTGEHYKVIERTQEASSTSIGGRRSVGQGSVDYITSCGVDLNPLDGDLGSFELIQRDGVIRKDLS